MSNEVQAPTKKKPRKKPVRRSQKQRLIEEQRKLDELRAKVALGDLIDAGKEGRVKAGAEEEYKALVRHLKGISGAPTVFSENGMEKEATAASQLRTVIIAKLETLVTAKVAPAADEEDDDDDDDDDDEDDDDEDDEDEDDEDEDEG